MPRESKGFFYRRAKGKGYIALDDPKHQDAAIFFCIYKRDEVKGKSNRKVFATCTNVLTEAQRRVKDWDLEALGATKSYDTWLRQLAMIGRRAEMEYIRRHDPEAKKDPSRLKLKRYA